MIGYKLVRKMKDGSLAPLFIDKKLRFPIGEWLAAKSVPTKGFALRPGFHATEKPIAPHLSTKGRVWCKVELYGVTSYDRPASQGGKWFTARYMQVLKEVN